MKINWRLRFGNKVTLTAIVVAIISLVYQTLSLFNIVPSFSQSQVIEIAGMLINVLVLLGIVTDPTTAGVSDSERALDYTEPN